MDDLKIPIADLAKIIQAINHVIHCIRAHECDDNQCDYDLELVKANLSFIINTLKLSDSQRCTLFTYLGENIFEIEKCIQTLFNDYFDENNKEINDDTSCTVEFEN